MRRVRDIEEGGFPEAFQEPNKRVQSLSLAVLDRTFLQGSNPDGVRTLVGAPPPLVPRARVQMRIPGETRIYPFDIIRATSEDLIVEREKSR